MDDEESQNVRMKNLHGDIIREIEKRSPLREKDLHELDIEEIEKKLKIKIVNPRKTPISFEWELSGKLGWQFTDLEFILEKEYEQRERDVDSAKV